MAKAPGAFAIVTNANIKAEIGRHDLTNQQIADASGSSVDTIRRRRAGESAWTLDEIEAIGLLVGVLPDELVRGDRSLRVPPKPAQT